MQSEFLIRPKSRRSGGTASSKALRILLIEDEAIIAMLLEEILIEMGHHVFEVEATEAGAIVSALENCPDLIISDAKLRAGSGISAMEHILQRSFVPHVFVSGPRLDKKTLHPRSVLLQKPFLEAELAKAIDEAMH